MALEIKNPTLPAAVVGEKYEQTLSAINSAGVLNWIVTPDLPAGLTLDKTTAIISGTPTAASGRAAYKFTVTDANGSADRTLMFGVSAVSTNRRFAPSLAAFLIAMSVITGYLLCSLWSSHPVTVPTEKLDCSTVKYPTLKSIYPYPLYVGSSEGILIEGCSLPTKPTVKMNGIEQSISAIDQNYIHLTPSAADLATPGPLVVTVSDDQGHQLTPLTLWVTLPQFYWSLFHFKAWEISLETQLLLLVLCAGSFASSVYALKSLADHRGDDNFSSSWSLYYLIQPLEGAGVAFLFYVAVRGGFLAGGSGDVRSVNQYGICAIAGLTGAFSDLAFMKLREVFQTLFRPEDTRTGKITTLKITTASLPTVVLNQVYDQTLAASGGNGVLTWSVTPGLPSSLSLDPATGRLHGTVTAALPRTTFTFSVMDRSTPVQSAKVELPLQVS